jgi:hypothetical protein
LGFDDRKLEKKFQLKKFDIFFSKIAIYYPYASIVVQATGEAFSPTREHPALQNIK